MKDNEGILSRSLITEDHLKLMPLTLKDIKDLLKGTVIVDEEEWKIVRDIIHQPKVAMGMLPEVLGKYPEIVPLIPWIHPYKKDYPTVFDKPLDMGPHSPTIDQTNIPPRGDEPTILYTEGDKVAIATLYNAMWGQAFAINDPETAMKQTIELYNKTIKNI